MSELKDLVWVEKYRPQSFEELIIEDKVLILNYLKNPKSVPSFIFYSSKPGTGKTSTAKLIIKELNCDALMINSSDERGIDVIREKIKTFARSLSSNNKAKRCVFLDEADGLTRQAQDSLRNLMEEYSSNVFFIFTANNIGKIIEPLKSRSQLVCFERPNKADIIARLEYVCEQEEIEWDRDNNDLAENLVETYYPDIRKMIARLQSSKVDIKPITVDEEEFEDFLALIKTKNVKGVYNVVYSGDFDIVAFNNWFFKKIFDNHKTENINRDREIALRLADNEKSWTLGVNIEMIFISNILDIMRIL